LAYFWVNQKQTWKSEWEGGYLWAPKLNENGKPEHHWETMRDVEAGDVIFSYANGAIGATSVAKNRAYDSPKPSDFGKAGTSWKSDGLRIDATYEVLSTPLPLSAFVRRLQDYLPSKYSPIQSDGSGANQGYLYALPPSGGRLLLDCLGIDEAGSHDVLEKAVDESTSESTERTSLQKSRIGQGPYRDNLLELWKKECAVTGLDLPQLLRASHIKPWRDSNNAERLDRYNGLLLSPGYDAAFDDGLISFNDDGTMFVSAILTDARLAQLGIVRGARITKPMHQKHRAYLEYHRLEVLNRSS